MHKCVLLLWLFPLSFLAVLFHICPCLVIRDSDSLIVYPFPCCCHGRADLHIAFSRVIWRPLLKMRTPKETARLASCCKVYCFIGAPNYMVQAFILSGILLGPCKKMIISKLVENGLDGFDDCFRKRIFDRLMGCDSCSYIPVVATPGVFSSSAIFMAGLVNCAWLVCFRIMCVAHDMSAALPILYQKDKIPFKKTKQIKIRYHETSSPVLWAITRWQKRNPHWLW